MTSLTPCDEEASKVNRIVLIWDEKRHPIILGGFFFLLQEGWLFQKKYQAEAVDLFIVGPFAKSLMSRIGPVQYYKKPGETDNVLLRTLLSIEQVKGIYLSEKIEDVSLFLSHNKTENILIWPSLDRNEPTDYCIGTGLVCSDFFRQGYSLSPLSFDRFTRNTAQDILKKIPSDKVILSVHLKNNPDLIGQSNARLDVWAEFMAAYKHEAIFLLLGNDAINPQISKLPHVYRAEDLGSDLATDFCLITMSNGFLGMASGLCQGAIFSHVPYAIFKNPDHHAEEMKQDLGDDDKFPFAHENQRIFRTFETVEKLQHVYRGLLTGKGDGCDG